MKLKTIIFIILSIIFIIIIFKFNKVNLHNENDKKPDTILNQTNQVQDNVKTKVIPFSGQYAMNLGVHIEGLSNGKEEIS